MKKGFTLVELLAVITVIGFLLALIVPKLTDVLAESEKSIEKESVKGILDAANLHYGKHMKDNPVDYNFNGYTNIYNDLKFGGKEPDKGIVYIKANGEIELRVLFKNTCYVKGFWGQEINEADKSLCDGVGTIPGNPN